MAEISESAECPSCGKTAEPEQDGDVLFYACECGFYFGYQAMAAEANTCAAGLPIDLVYSAAQPPGVVTLKSDADSRSIFLGGTIRRRPADGNS